jgi:hypothetical protein
MQPMFRSWGDFLGEALRFCGGMVLILGAIGFAQYVLTHVIFWWWYGINVPFWQPIL